MNKGLMIIGMSLLLTGCGGSMQFDSTSVSTDSQQSIITSANSTASATSVSMKQRYLYVLLANGGGIITIPIDSETGDLIQAQTGNWIVKPVNGTGNFYTMAINPNGKMLYALLRNPSLQSKIYQYAITDVAYSAYGSDRPLVENATKAITNVIPGLFSWGNNGNLFIQNYNFTPTKVDSYTFNTTSSLLSAPTTLGTETTVSTTYGLNFTRITQVSYENHTYMIDAQTNRVIHYKDGVIQSSFDANNGGTQYTLTDIAIQ